MSVQEVVDVAALLPGFEAETSLEHALLTDPAVLRGLAWGTPRYGHPEGTVANHVAAMLARIAGDDPDREALRALAIVHDAGKSLVLRSGAWTPEHDHAFLGRRLMSRYTDDERLLAAVELHDEPYWRWKVAQGADEAAIPAERGLDSRLFARFVELDASSEGKDVSFLWWFRRSTVNLLSEGGADWSAAPLIDGDAGFVYTKALAVEPENQSAVADALRAVAGAASQAMRAEFDVLSSQDGLRTLLLWRWRGDPVGRLLRDGPIVRRALREHAPLRAARAVEARIFMAGLPGSHLWEPR